MSDDGGREKRSFEVRGPSRGNEPCGFPCGELWDGDGDRWWRVEMRGRGCLIVHQLRPLVVALTSDLVEGGHVQAYVRRLGVPEMEAASFDALCSLYRAPGYAGGRRTNNERDNAPPKHPPKELRRTAMESGSRQLLRRLGAA
jgi:hypothetical protein